MRYIKLTLAYMKNKHYWKLMLLLLIPAVLLSLISSYGTTASFFVNFFNCDLTKFEAVFSLFTELSTRTWLRLLLFALLAVVMSAFFAITVGVVYKHMRTGRFLLRNIPKRINENFLPALFTILAIYLIVFLFGLFVAIFVYFWFWATKNMIATFVMSLISMLIIFAFLVIFISLLCLTCPYIVATGKGLFSAVSASIKTTRSKLFSIIIAMLLPLLPMAALEYGVSFANIYALSLVIDTLINSVMFSYYPVLFFVIFYDINGWEREDLKLINTLY